MNNPKFKPGDVIDRTNMYKHSVRSGSDPSIDFVELILNIRGDCYVTYRFLEGSVYNPVGSYHIPTTDTEFTIIDNKSLIDAVKQQYMIFQLAEIVEK